MHQLEPRLSHCTPVVVFRRLNNKIEKAAPFSFSANSFHPQCAVIGYYIAVFS